MELMLRCALPDRPGALASLAGTIAEMGGDIQAVDVVETSDERALDDLVILVAGPGEAHAVVERVRALPEIELVHAGPSRGDPGGAVTRLAVGLEAVLSGAMDFAHGLEVLLGGLLRAGEVSLCDAEPAPREDGRTLVLRLDERCVVVQRDYRFTDTERRRAEAVAAVCRQAAQRQPWGSAG